jgi:hypothetical protein
VTAGGVAAASNLQNRLLRYPVWARGLIFAAVLLLASLAGILAAASPQATLAGTVFLAIILAVIFHPPVAAYVLLFTTPLIVGIDRGTVVPLLRPSEAMAIFLGGALLTRSCVRAVSRERFATQISRIHLSMIALATCGSVVPLLWMIARNEIVTQDDFLYAFTLWKYYAVFLIVRSSVLTEGQVRVCLWLSLASACVVSVIGMLQAVELFGVPQMLATYYAPFSDTASLEINRATSTLSNPQATADLLAFNAAIAIAWLLRPGTVLPRRRTTCPTLIFVALLCVFGAVASGTFSGVLALGLCALTVGVVSKRLAIVSGATIGVVSVAALALRPVVEERLTNSRSPTGVPSSWIGRLDNLRTYFWPELFSKFNYVLGIRPSARIAVPGEALGYVWIESGYTWLLWTGGIPLLASFFFFVWSGITTTVRVARLRTDAIGVAATASVAGLVALTVLMILDPHLALRGSADLNFSLVALATAGIGPGRGPEPGSLARVA